MTYGDGPRFCGTCGAAVDPAAPRTFCTSCGAGLTPAPAHTPAAPLPPVATAQGTPTAAIRSGLASPPADPFAARAAQPRRRGRNVVVGVVLLMLVGAGSAAGVLYLGDQDDRLRDAYGNPLESALQAAPGIALDFSLPAGDTITGVVAAEDTLVTSGDDSAGIVALDMGDGSEQWTYPDGHVIGVARDGDQVLVVEDGSVTALSSGNGSEQWRVPGATNAAYLDEGVLIAGGQDVTMVDESSGEEMWQVQGHSTFALSPDALLAAQDRTLVAYDLREGAQLWSVPLDGDDPDVVPASDMVVVLDDATLSAYGLEDGSLLWSEDAADASQLTQFGARRVALSGGFATTDGSTAQIYSSTGPLGTVRLEDLGDLRGVSVGTTADDYIVTEDGRLYAGSGDLLTRFPGAVAAVAEGVYAIDPDNGVAFFRLPAVEPAWTTALPPEATSDARLLPLPGGVAVIENDTVTVYRGDA